MTATERIVKEWLVSKGYSESDIVFNRKGSPDFILPDGRRIEVKRPISGCLWFTHKQLSELSDGDEIVIVHESNPNQIFSVKFSEIKGGRTITIGGKTLKIVVAMDEKIVIKCSPETRMAFSRFIANNNYKSAEEALRALLKQAGFLREARGF
jgi:hypothetical protein